MFRYYVTHTHVPCNISFQPKEERETVVPQAWDIGAGMNRNKVYNRWLRYPPWQPQAHARDEKKPTAYNAVSKKGGQKMTPPLSLGSH
jgi:hypothetical protein